MTKLSILNDTELHKSTKYYTIKKRLFWNDGTYREYTAISEHRNFSYDEIEIIRSGVSSMENFDSYRGNIRYIGEEDRPEDFHDWEIEDMLEALEKIEEAIDEYIQDEKSDKQKYEEKLIRKGFSAVVQD